MYHTVTAIIMGILLGIGVEVMAQERALRMIIVRDRQAAQDIRQKLQQGASFSVLAREQSIGPERRKWGYSGIVRLDDVQAELRSVLQKLQPGQISEVLSLGRRYVLVKVIPLEIPRLFETAKEALQQGQGARAIESLRTALRLEPDNVQTYMSLALAYEHEAQYEEALKQLDKAQQLAPKEVEIAILRGALATNAAIKRQDQMYAKKAIVAYQQALQLDARLAPAVNFGLGKVYLLALKQPDKALSYLETAIASSPSVPEVYGMLIQAYYDTQRYQQAWERLRQAQNLGFEFPHLLAALHKVKEQQSQR
jgi:tetratricopeptide (TPR) repeat protein